MVTTCPNGLGREAGRLGHRLRPRVIAVRGEYAIHVSDLKTLAELEPKFVVHRVPIANVETTDRFECGSRKKRAWLSDCVSFFELATKVELDRVDVTNRVAVFVDLAPAAVNQIGSALLKCLHGGRDRPCQVKIVGVEPAE